MDCIDDTNDPCYWRKPEHKCGRGPEDGPCIHIQDILKRKEKKNEGNS